MGQCVTVAVGNTGSTGVDPTSSKENSTNVNIGQGGEEEEEEEEEEEDDCLSGCLEKLGCNLCI